MDLGTWRDVVSEKEQETYQSTSLTSRRKKQTCQIHLLTEEVSVKRREEDCGSDMARVTFMKQNTTQF